MTEPVRKRRVAYARRPGGPDVLQVDVEDLASLNAGEILVRVEAAGLNHVERLIRTTRTRSGFHAGVTAAGLVRHWPLEPGASAIVWGAAGAVGLLLVAYLAERGVRVIGIASGARIDAVRAAGATHVVDRASEDVYDAGLHAPAKPNSTRDPRMISRVFSCTERLPVNVSA